MYDIFIVLIIFVVFVFIVRFAHREGYRAGFLDGIHYKNGDKEKIIYNPYIKDLRKAKKDDFDE